MNIAGREPIKPEDISEDAQSAKPPRISFFPLGAIPLGAILWVLLIFWLF